MSDFDWRVPKAYANIDKADRPGVAWECLRRDKEYHDRYHELRNPKVSAPQAFRARWRMVFRR